jgi:hypothetical protein
MKFRKKKNSEKFEKKILNLKKIKEDIDDRRDKLHQFSIGGSP